jgi:hypothetical protein
MTSIYTENIKNEMKKELNNLLFEYIQLLRVIENFKCSIDIFACLGLVIRKEVSDKLEGEDKYIYLNLIEENNKICEKIIRLSLFLDFNDGHSYGKLNNFIFFYNTVGLFSKLPLTDKEIKKIIYLDYKDE